ncbi:ABC transporter permease [Granulosicoccus antarcticus]|uniref:Putative siderophore transport system permease protein YfhA n=1 Tax=Granulosicoccus antarcticus IMCC3135 TaxID=1192854 RepID=A0A2Z2NWP6_9GAMM|nr:iron chelate uptake ABC transporter family permease subunit [Granulosicoccus antarcticus]ASJ71584.1 putative siderophore transport system permease protein YfhA [Granulosicoccus antarcticus IMCC3135]
MNKRTTLFRLSPQPGLAIGALAICVIASLFIGVIDMRPSELFTDPEALWLLSVSRLPRTLAVLLTGVSLAIAGQVLQVLVQNRFVEPSTAGSGQSAVLGIVLITLLFPASSIVTKMIAASIGALLGTLLFLLMIRKLPVQETYLVPLVGIVYGGVIGAIATWLAWQADLLQLLDIWMTGEFSGMMRGRYGLLWIAGILAVFTYFVADQFTIASLGRDQARNLGLDYRTIMALGLLVVSVVTAVTIVTVGIIPFIGLVVPNIVSRLRGDNLRYSLPLVAWLGAMLTLLSDMLGRLLIAPYEIPVGTVFGVVGAVVTLWLLYSRPAARQA